ncbi:unnamed protein product [Peniophora sp. CBMAI 1063]|nr:unnamed protein product [Peniophora sp. CBMAI 1063]
MDGKGSIGASIAGELPISLWRDIRIIPTYIAAASALTSLLLALVGFRHLSGNSGDHKAAQTDNPVERKPFALPYRLVRALCVIVLLSLYAFDLLRGLRISPNTPIANEDGVRLALFLTYLYASSLATIDTTLQSPISRVATSSLVLILAASFAVYCYRDLWPLMTYTLSPADSYEGLTLWIKIALLAVAAVVVPLIMPRRSPTLLHPETPSNSQRELNPEQTCSLLSLLTYSFLDSDIYVAYTAPRYTFDMLPEIADYDRMSYLVHRGFKHLDVFSGAPKHHIFFALTRVFAWEWALLAGTMVLHAVTAIFAPIGINRLLNYLETGGVGATVRPWVWCLLMLVGPGVGSLLSQLHDFIANATVIRVECMITQLVFEHALRIRLTANGRPSDVRGEVSPAIISAGAPPEGAETTIGEEPEGQHLDTNLDSPPVSESPQPTPAGATSQGQNVVGKINNLITTDVQRIANARNIMITCLFTPISIAVSVYFLYTLLGWSTFVGVTCTIACLPIPGFLASRMQGVFKVLAEKADARVETVSEALNVIRMIKMFGWERRIAGRIASKRAEELRWLRHIELLQLLNSCVTYVIPVLQMVATIATFTLIMKEELTPSIVFPAMSVFMGLRGQISMLFGASGTILRAKVSLDRITSFLQDSEVLDRHTDAHRPQYPDQPEPSPHTTVIGMHNASFAWDTTSLPNENSTIAQRAFTLRIPGELLFERGKINLIVGPTGSGKTSLLMALLGEMHFTPLAEDAWVSLPREDGVAYAAQDSWVQNETIRDNILFGAPYDDARYKKVIYQCGLERDLSSFKAGDWTEVGEKGLTLSGGQKARVTLARAVYSSANILLLDDVFAALDVHTAKWIVEKCLKGDLIRGRTVILVTHNVALAGPIADFFVSVGRDGSVTTRHSYGNMLETDKTLAREAAMEEELLTKADEEVDRAEGDEAVKQAEGKLVVDEEIAEGRVSLHALSLFWSALGGKHPFLFWTTFLGSVTVYQLLGSLQSLWLGRWADAYARPGPVDITYYMSGFLLLILGALCGYALSSGTYLFGIIRAARAVHARLIDTIVGTTLHWLDATPMSRILTRCTKDVDAVDGWFATLFIYLVRMAIAMLVDIIAIAVVSPVAMLPGIVVFLAGAWCGNIYMKAQLPVKRVMSNKKAPVLGHFGAAIAGLTSIRAYGAEDAFRYELYRRLEEYIRCSRMYYNLSCWIGIRTDVLGGFFSSSIGAYFVYGPASATIGASNVGFALSMAIGFSGMILYCVQFYNDFEVQGNSLERIQAYLEIEQEPKPVASKAPPASWPTSGSLRVEDLSARYAPDGPVVLHDLTFIIKSGERIGIVGRTGSGKSTLTLSLLRCIFTTGNVYYDGVNTADINLHALRASITIIPQVPELLSGTLRENLDPFGEHDDATLNSALRSAGLYSLQGEAGEGRITLDTHVSSGGGNLSVGQRQILALARALVRGSKLLILDEATSSIDHETDEIIQSSLRTELGDDVTLLIVAHRLQTIMDADRIMVLDAGRIVEFDSPTRLLGMEGGLFKSLVDESVDREVPELLSGTLRENLDPFGEHDDATLNSALRSAGLYSLQGATGESRITFDTHVSNGGSNLSVGKRQILALARALVRDSKLLVLDEATSSIDHATDGVMQASLREGGLFRSLVDESVDKDVLYNILRARV